MLAPLFILLLLGMVAYGIYFGASHSVQQIAADGARTAIAGLNQTERQALTTLRLSLRRSAEADGRCQGQHRRRQPVRGLGELQCARLADLESAGRPADAINDDPSPVDDPRRGHMMRGTTAAILRSTLRLIADRRANFAIMTALSAPVALALTAFAVDEGALFNERRAAQSIVDLAAIIAAANINNAETAVLTTLKDNGITSVAVQNKGQILSRPPPRRSSRSCQAALRDQLDCRRKQV
jgi:Flp pilus assembly protein TadG